MRGIDKFRERFKDHEGEYVLIGGGACDLLFGEAGQNFRATKDLDLVLLVEALTPKSAEPFGVSSEKAGTRTSRRASANRNSTGFLTTMPISSS